MSTRTPQSLPLVTAIVGCYNHARFVEEALASVKAQTYPNLQLIVFDDCSRDDSVALIERWLAANAADATFLKHERNIGVCRSLNDALKYARGVYVALLGADDVWLPGKTTDQVQIMESLPPSVGVVYTDAYRIDERGEFIPGMFIASYRNFSAIPSGDIRDVLWGGNFIPAMTTLIRAECFRVCGGYDETLCFEDWDMWLRLAEHFTFSFSDVVSAKYRIVGTSMCRTARREMEQSEIQVLIKHLQRGTLPERLRSEAFVKHARMRYESGAIDGHALLRAAWRLYPSKGTLAMYVASGLGISYRRFQAFEGLWKPARAFVRRLVSGAQRRCGSARE